MGCGPKENVDGGAGADVDDGTNTEGDDDTGIFNKDGKVDVVGVTVVVVVVVVVEGGRDGPIILGASSVTSLSRLTLPFVCSTMKLLDSSSCSSDVRLLLLLLLLLLELFWSFGGTAGPIMVDGPIGLRLTVLVFLLLLL